MLESLQGVQLPSFLAAEAGDQVELPDKLVSQVVSSILSRSARLVGLSVNLKKQFSLQFSL